MSEIRSDLWSYPDAVIPIIKKFQTFFTIVSCLTLGFIIAFSFRFLFTLQKAAAFDEKTYTEGFVGDSISVNPLAQSSTTYEKELTGLVFSSLVKVDPSGKLFPDLSDAWTISTDGKTYTFFLRKGVTWHDGVEFTSEDVKTTFELIKAGGQNFPNGVVLKDVAMITPDRYEIEFRLLQPNASFVELLGVGIVPSHIFQGYTYTKYITEIGSTTPIGTGPYRYTGKNGKIHTFKAYEKYFSGKPEITTLRVKTYDSEIQATAAFLDGDVNTLINISSNQLNFYGQYKTLKTENYELSNNTRVLYFNLTTNKAALSKNVRTAFAQSIDKLELVQQIPGAQIAYGPYSNSSWVYNKNVETLLPYNMDKAKSLLDTDNWKFSEKDNKRMKDNQPLILSLTYLENDTNTLIVKRLKEYGAQIGIDIVLTPVSKDVLLQQVLPQRDFELLIFEVQTTIDPDLYTLWHSSQGKYPGLNISGYDSNRADGYLVQGRTSSNRDRRFTLYQQFQEQIVNDVPAVFLYHPPLYTVGFDIIKRPESVDLVVPGQRLTSLTKWIIEPRWRNWQTR